MNENLFTRAEILIQQGRYEEAEKVLSEILSQDPNNTYLLSMCSEVAGALNKPEEAHDLISQAIALEPDNDTWHYVQARHFYRNSKNKSAEKSISIAIDINPSDADYFALLAQIYFSRKDFDKALSYADEALELDAENLMALNTRSSALLKLDRKEESFRTIQEALQEDPNNSFTHANFGWSLLEKGDNVKSLEHFKLSLQGNPNNSYAQAGMIEALKGRYWFYRLFLKYSFWMSNLTGKYQWGVIIGFYLLFRVLSSVGENNPGLSKFITPVLILMAVLAFSTWVMNPIGNLLLRLNKYGQYLLDKEEKMSSNLVGISVLVLLMGLLFYLTTGSDPWLSVVVYGFAMMVPFSVMFAQAKYKNVLIIYAIGMALTGLLSIYVTFSTGILFNLFSTVFLIGFIAFQWGANFLMIRQDKEE